MLGPVDHDQLPALIATATVCVVPAARDLTPNPTVVYPTKLLEYMACRRAIVAPQPRDRLDGRRERPRGAAVRARRSDRPRAQGAAPDRRAAAARSDRRSTPTSACAATSPRARRAARCAHAYNVLAERFADQFAERADDDAPKVEMLADDDFEATVFEEAPQPPAVDTALNRARAARRRARARSTRTGERRASRSRRRRHASRRDDGARAGRRRGPRDQPTAAWTVSALARAAAAAGPGRLGRDERRRAVRALDDERRRRGRRRRATTARRSRASPPPRRAARSVESSFVAGEIDVPTPPPERATTRRPAVEFTAASELLGNAEPADPDTGSRTPPLERALSASGSRCYTVAGGCHSGRRAGQPAVRHRLRADRARSDQAPMVRSRRRRSRSSCCTPRRSSRRSRSTSMRSTRRGRGCTGSIPSKLAGVVRAAADGRPRRARDRRLVRRRRC